VIVGTAGHIDHGKTALLQALTGQAGDRRREERERGMTIDLGYLYAALEPGAGLTGFIDVPGHERFTHNMLAGAQGIDLVLLVVAADDGVMPQTREHLAIVELLGIPGRWWRSANATGSMGRVQDVCEQINAAGARPLCRCAADCAVERDRAGHRHPASGLAQVQREVVQRSHEGGFRLWIDRAFSVAGAGIVVTGTALSGQVAVGDTLMLGPPANRCGCAACMRRIKWPRSPWPASVLR
jgi:selenocysteine-specific elongation factor